MGVDIKMNTGKYVIEYGKEPFLDEHDGEGPSQMQREASGALGHRVNNFAWVVVVSRWSGERTLNELRNHRKYSDTRTGMNKWIKHFKKMYPSAKVQKLGFD
jgi:hypothetical protein